MTSTLGTNCGMSTGRNGIISPSAFAVNQRDEARDLHDLAGALGARPGMKQQTFIAEGGKRQEPDGLPHAAAFSAGQGAKAGGIGYQEECAPTLKASESRYQHGAERPVPERPGWKNHGMYSGQNRYSSGTGAWASTAGV